MMNDPIRSIMSNKLITVGPKENLRNVRDIFKNNKIHHLPVVEDKKLVGLITTKDLWKLNRKHDEYSDMIVENVMTVRLACLKPSDKIGSAAELFLENLFHAVPIVDEEKVLVGLITSFDVIKYNFLKEYPNHQFS